ncbi:eukaryotic-like serine/threonine-protein kinase [Anaerolineales bacterium]|nr:eukaryotic-like serine/threonine-protein kinase [Anaerolineales bacterium]
MSFNIGESVGPYRIIEQLGQGGMATVYKAYHASLDRYVALKVLHPAFNEDQTFISRFQREARVVAKLEYPNIVPIYDYSEHEKRPYLVMKYIEGDTLKARLTQGPLTSEEIEQVVNSVGAALEHAHRQGILHRDIKPSNVMIAKDGNMYLADFGLARIAQAGESTMSSDSIMGTPQYISPEQAMGKKDLDAGTDIYSFGVMLYELVVGQVPFSADTPFSVIHDHIYTPLPLPKKVNPNVPEPVQRVLLKALAKDRIDRYATVEELMIAFKEAWTEAGVPMQGTAIIMRASMPKDRTGSKKQTNEAATATPAPVKKGSLWMWVGIGLVILLCLAVMGLTIRNRFKRPTMPLPAATQPSVAQPLPDTPPDAPGEEQPVPAIQNDSPELIAAKDLVAKNPNDPDARLTLALEFWDAKEIRPAMDEMTKAADLAGPDKRDFLAKAAEKFMQRQAWAPAASLYLRMALTGKQGLPSELMGNLHESVYKAAEQKEMPLFLPFDRIEQVDPALSHIAHGRHIVYNASQEEAMDAVVEMAAAEKINPDMPEISLLKAEYEMKIGNQDEAKKTLLALTSRPDAPEWIRIMAENYLKLIQ